MTDFDKLYDCFEIMQKGKDSLRRLAEPEWHIRRSPGQIIVETVVVEDGERRVIKTEVITVSRKRSPSR